MPEGTQFDPLDPRVISVVMPGWDRAGLYADKNGGLAVRTKSGGPPPQSTAFGTMALYGYNLEPARASFRTRLDAALSSGSGGSILIAAADSIARGANAGDPQLGVWPSMLWDALHQIILGRPRRDLGFVDIVHTNEVDDVTWPSDVFRGGNYAGRVAAISANPTNGRRFVMHESGLGATLSAQNGVTFKSVARAAGAAVGRLRMTLDPGVDPRFGATSVMFIMSSAPDGGSHTFDSTVLLSSDTPAYLTVGGGTEKTGAFATGPATVSYDNHLGGPTGMDPTLRRTVQLAPTTTAPSTAVEGAYVFNGGEKRGFHVVNIARYGYTASSFTSSDVRMKANLDDWCDGSAPYRNALLAIPNLLTNDSSNGSATYAANVATILARFRSTASKPAVVWFVPPVKIAGDSTYDANILANIGAVYAAAAAASTPSQPVAVFDMNLMFLRRAYVAGSYPTLAEIRTETTSAASRTAYFSDGIHQNDAGNPLIADAFTMLLG